KLAADSGQRPSVEEDISDGEDRRCWSEGGDAGQGVELVERRRAGVAVQLLQKFKCLLPSPVEWLYLESAVLVLLAKLLRADDVDARVVAVPESIYAAEALGHSFERGEVADHVIGRDVHANFAGARADEVDCPGGRRDVLVSI